MVDQSVLALHVKLQEFAFAVGVFAFEQQFEGSAYWFVVALVAVDVPVFEDDQLFGVVAVEEDAVAPGRRAFGVVYFLSFDVFVGGQEVDGALAVKSQ